MEYRQLGGSGLKVPALSFGTGTFGGGGELFRAWGATDVAEAKRQVFGRVGIDSIAGPSEVVVVADASNDPRLVAVDLLAQAEHDESAQAILVTDDAGFADLVASGVVRGPPDESQQAETYGRAGRLG